MIPRPRVPEGAPHDRVAGTMEGYRSSALPLDAAVDIPEKPLLFRGFLRWKKVWDDFFHGQ